MNRRGFLAVTSAIALGGVAVSLANSGSPANGTLRTNVPMRSEILGTEVPYTVYLPERNSDTETVPIVYLLHGVFDNNVAWARHGNIKNTLDEMISNGQLPPIVVVTPDARRDTNLPAEQQPATYYMNDADGAFRWEDMFIEELIPHVEAEYNAGGTPGQRAISGYSMGGFGAFLFATMYPGTFAGVAGLSTSHRTGDQIVEMDPKTYNQSFGAAWGFDLEGEDRLNEHWRHYDLADIIRRTPPEDLQRTEYYLDIGNADESRIAGNDELSQLLADKDIEHDYYTHPGAHDWAFWAPAVVRGLEFLGSTFHAGAD